MQTLERISTDTNTTQPNAPKARVNWLITSSLLVLATLFVCEAAARVVFVVGQFNPINSDEFLLKTKLAQTPSTKPIVAYAGSSYSAASVYSEFEAAYLHKLGIECDVRNLAMSGNGAAPSVQLHLLQKSVQSGNKPAILFYDVSPFAGYFAPQLEQQREPSPFTPYLFQYRARLAGLLRNLPTIIATPNSAPSGGAAAHQTAISDRGWGPKFESSNENVVTKSVEIRRSLMKKNGDAVKAIQQSFEILQPIQRFCYDNNIRLVLVWYPATTESDALFTKAGITPDSFMEQAKIAAKQFHAKFFNLHGQLPPEFFSDCDHVNAAGAIKVTEKMIQLIDSEQFRAVLRADKK